MSLYGDQYMVLPPRLGTGTRDGTKYLRDDGTWVFPTLSSIGTPTGSVNFNDQQATSFRIENRTTDPSSPTVGQLWLRTDL